MDRSFKYAGRDTTKEFYKHVSDERIIKDFSQYQSLSRTGRQRETLDVLRNEARKRNLLGKLVLK